MGAFWRSITGDSQLRWVGPEKGVIHLATAAVVNAVWDLWAKVEGKPLWKLLADMTPEAARRAASTSATSPTRSRPRRRSRSCAATRATQAPRASARCERDGYPAYTTSAGWLGYPDDKMRRAVPRGAGRGLDALQDQGRRATSRTTSAAAAIIREEIGPDRKLMMDANQVWDVDEAIA